MVKILATSDMHGNLDGLDLSWIDIAVFAGDISPLRGRGPWHVYDQIKWIRSKFTDWCKQWSRTEIVFIPGNHDFFPIARERFGSQLAERDLSLKTSSDSSSNKFGSSNMHMLLDEKIEIDGLSIYGTPWVPVISHSWAFEAESDFQKEKFSSIPNGLDILVAHTPPRLNYLDVSLEYGVDSDRFGSSVLADEIFRKQPKLVFCGHIHSGDHIMNKLGNSEIYNVSRVNESYDIAYDPVVLEI